MRTSRTHTSEVESRNEKRKRKREKQLSPDNRVGVNEVNNISDASETDNNRKKHVPSFCNLEACEPVLTQTSEQQSALLDKILQLEDNFTAQNMENHTTINTKRKKLKRGKKRNTGENSFHDQRPVETSPYSLPEDVQSNSSLDIVKVDSLRNNKEAPTNDCVLPLAPVASEDSGLKKSKLVPENSSNSHEVKNDGLICAEKAKQKGKSVSFNMEKVQDYVPSPLTNVAQEGICAESSTLMKCVQLDSVEKNTSGASTSNNLTSLVNKEEISLTNGIETGTTKKVGMSSEIKSMNHGESKKTKKKAKTKKGKGQNDTSESSSLTDITEKESPRDNMISAVNKEENVDMEGRISEKDAEADLPKENEVTNICSIQTGISKEKKKGNCSDGVIKPLQGDVANSSVKTPISKKGRNKKKKLKHATPEERSSMNETVEMNYGLLDELPKTTKNCVVSVEENLDGSSTYSEVSLPHSSAQGTIDVTEKESPRDNMISAVNKEENVDMEGRISEKDAEADLPKENEVTNICSIQTGISKEKKKGNCSDGVIKPLQGDVANSSVKTPVSKKGRNKKKKLKHATPEERSSMNETVEMNYGLLDELPKATKNCVVSVEENLDGSSTYSEVSLPHSSAQGTIDVTEKESPRDNMISAVNKEENVDMEGRISEKDAEADLPKENEVTNICSIQTGISKEKKKGNCSDGVIKPLQGDVANSSVKTPISKKGRNKKKKLKHATPEERSSMNETVEMNYGLLDELPKTTKNCVVSVEENLDGSSTYSEVSLPHYSGQGTTDASPLTNKEDSSFKGEKASFSYQVIGNTVKNELYVDHSEKAPESNKRDKRKNEKPSHSVDNALHDNNTFTPSSEQLEQKNEDFNELQRHNILSKEKISTGSRKVKKVSSPSFDVVADEVALDVIDKCEKLDKAPLSPERAILTCTRKKLLVLDLNGLLVDVIYDSCNAHKAPIKVGGKSVFKRPFCDEFLEFCFDVFDVGVWSSRRKKNVSDVVDFLMRDLKHKLLFCWDQSKCTITGFNTIENVHKPLVLKELKKLWNKEELDLPWEKGQYSPSNTLLVDDSPYKALCNPPYTAIFPHPYNFQNEDDKSLGPAGDIRVYLEGLAMVDDVQNYVRENPFGQRAITSSNPSWKFYLRVIDTTQSYSVPTC